MKKLVSLTWIFASLLMTGCTIGGYIDMDEIKSGGKTVTAEDSFSTFIGFGYDSELTSRVRSQLLKKCGGKMTGVTTRMDISWYVFVNKYTLKAEATCSGKA